MQAEPHGGGFHHALRQLLVVAGGALGFVLLLTFFAFGAGTADAAGPEETDLRDGTVTLDAEGGTSAASRAVAGRSATTLDAGADVETVEFAADAVGSEVVRDVARDDDTATLLRADPGIVSAAAARRAGGTPVPPPAVLVPVEWSNLDDAPLRGDGGNGALDSAPTPAGTATSTPIGSFGGGGGAASNAPSSTTQLAIVAAALLCVLWLWQRLHGDELSWTSALITLQVERPG